MPDPSTQTLNFEDALAELESIVNQLEEQELSLEKLVELYERGTILQAHCSGILDQVKHRIEKLENPPSQDYPSIDQANHNPDSPTEAESSSNDELLF